MNFDINSTPLDLTGEKYRDVPYEEKERLFNEIKADVRFHDVLYGCYECGVCVAACPSARFYDFSPRVIAQAVAREDVELVYTLMNDSIWDCSQCFSCDRCPRGNSPGGLITLMREVAVKNGLETAKEALEGYGRIIYKIMSTGTQVSPDMLQPNAFPDWGHHVNEIAENLDLWRRALPPETLHTVETGWSVSEKTIIELYLIWHMTGVMDMIKEIDEGLFMILQDVMEERLEDAGYDVLFDE
ncbi:MAG: heterodisulfide reductase subunit C [Calditrichaeota bacterium]|nr:heterodisulfide reductase subunit C [Calditrichota bacterium]